MRRLSLTHRRILTSTRLGCHNSDGDHRKVRKLARASFQPIALNRSGRFSIMRLIAALHIISKTRLEKRRQHLPQPLPIRPVCAIQCAFCFRLTYLPHAHSIFPLCAFQYATQEAELQFSMQFSLHIFLNYFPIFPCGNSAVPVDFLITLREGGTASSVSV